MAEVVAREILQEMGILSIQVKSAGVYALNGCPASPEAREALKARGWHLEGASTSLGISLAAEVDQIWCMTQAHVNAVSDLLISGGFGVTNIKCLDPDGDIDDPIGLGSVAYKKLLDSLESLIRMRVKDFMETQEN